MAWGAPRGIDDIIARIRANDASLTSLYLMRQRRFDLADATALCDALSSNTVLHDLNISSHAVSPEIAAAFASLLASTATLKSLDLGNASFGDQGVAALCPGIASSSSLLCLNLENKGLTAVGCAPLSHALNRNSRLQELILARNTIGQQGLTTLCGGGCALATLKILSLTECGLSGTDSATVLSTLLSTSSTLQVLRLEENTGIDAAFINAMSAGLGVTNSLRELHLRGCSQLQSQGITTLFQNLPTTLTHLDLSGTGAGPEGLTAAAGAVIQHSSGGSAVNLNYFVACGCGGDDPSLAALISSLSGTLHLDFSGNSVGHLTINAIAGHARLRAVCLHDCKLGVEGGDALCEQILLTANSNSFIDLVELDISANGLETPQLVNILNALESTAAAAATANDDKKMCCCLVNLKQLVIAANPGAMEIEVTEAIGRVQSVRPELDVVRRSADTGERDNTH